MDPEKRDWDVIVVGTGIGGAVIGHALAKAGKRVLFCEKGKSHLNNPSSLKGDYAEKFFPRREIPQAKHDDILAQAGRWRDEIEDISTSRTLRFVPFIGSGTGGSSALYGMAMERFFASDFSPKRHYMNDNDSTLPEEWPIRFDDLLPYYIDAERLFRVHGTADPLRGKESFGHLLPPPPLSPTSEELQDFFLTVGLHPYRLPMACDFVPDCECCQGYLCHRNCKNDSSRICLEPAVREFGAELLDECEVIRLDATRTEVTGVVCSWRGQQMTLRGDIVILAANALETPRILLNSASSDWPAGLVNDSGLVGRNLMRHYIDLYVIQPKTKQKFTASLKELAFNDFYDVVGQKFGTVQSFGSLPPVSILVEGMQEDLRKSTFPLIASLFCIPKPAIRLFLKHLFSRRVILASIMEDLPYRDNMVTLSNKTDEHGRRKLAVRYQIKESEKRRIETFRKKLSKVLAPYRFMLIKQAENNERLAHACGTCRFGLDSKKSVLDENNRALGLSNLYIVDSSFFPSSGGTNPGLTIAANALRVSDHIIRLRNISV
jgi:choline dehydrogenase-like flavoprotein